MKIDEATLLDDLEHHRLPLPTLPEVALRIREAVEAEDSSVREVAEVIATDPSLTARLLQIANSPMYRGARQVDSIQKAVGVLGLATVRSLVTSLVMKQLFQATHPVIDAFLRELWERSVEVAAVSRLLAAGLTRLDPDTAMLGGLVHAIGVAPILLRAEDDPELVDDAPRLRALAEKLYPHVGKVILEEWHFPAALVAVAEQHVHFERDTGADQPDYVDVVIVALLQTLAGAPDACPRVDATQVSAFRRLGVEPNFEQVEIGAPEDADELRHALAG